jgi:glutathione reductase (NADPH)
MEGSVETYDVVIIGSGTAGQTAAYALAQYGVSVGLVERSQKPGGVCALAGCQAKKWFYEATETVARTRHLLDKGIIQAAAADWNQVLTEKNAFTAKIPSGTVAGLESEGVEFIEGTARFINPETLDVGGETIRAGFFIIATGAVPMKLPIAGAENMITSTEFLDLPSLPDAIVLIGGGFISFEFAHFAARLGPENRRITILEAASRPLAPFDAEMVQLLVEASVQEGISIHTGVTITGIEKSPGGFRVITQGGEIFSADLVVHSAGRVADIQGLDLREAGIEYTDKGIRVDRNMRTTKHSIYAVGDCAATVQLARVADYEGYTAAKNILAEIKGGRLAEIDYTAVPAILFTYPQLGMIGKTEETLKQEGVEYRKSAAKHLNWPTYRRIGMKHAAYKILVGTDSLILGAHILSDNASGIINTVKHAMLNRISVDELYRQSIMTPYPSRESDLIYMLKPFLPKDYLMQF